MKNFTQPGSIDAVLGPAHFFRTTLLLGGLATGLIGVGHTIMPTLGYRNSVSIAMDPPIRDHFYYLATYAICAFLLSFAALSIYFSTIPANLSSLVVCSVLAAFWIVRAVLETIYPVEVPIFFLEKPHLVLFPIILLLALAYSISALSGWIKLR